MSPRHNRRQRNGTGTARSEERSGGERTDDFDGMPYVVRQISGSAGGKTYRCPGCDQEVPPGTPHVVVWPSGDLDARDRRHWHSPCWSARHRRTAKLHRAKNAPHYG